MMARDSFFEMTGLNNIETMTLQSLAPNERVCLLGLVGLRSLDVWCY